MDSRKRRTRVAGVMVAAGLTAVAAAVGVVGVSGAGVGVRSEVRTPAAAATLARATRLAVGSTTLGPSRLTVDSKAALVAGVGPIPSGWVATAHTVVVAGLTRQYLTVEPAHLTPGLPVVLLMHGRGMTPDTVLRISRLADQVGPAVVVVPAGWDRSWNAGDCCGAAYRAGVDDVAFVRTVMTAVLSADPGGRTAKVYAVGFSNGGRLAYLLACQMPGVFTGFVAVEAVPVEACTPPRPLDVTIVAQQSDPLLTMGGVGGVARAGAVVVARVLGGDRLKSIDGFTEPTVAATVTRMEVADHCYGQGAATHAGLAVERTWACSGGTDVRYVWYPGGGHEWRPPTPGTPGVTDFVRQMLATTR